MMSQHWHSRTMNTTQCIQLLLDAFDHPLPLSRHAAIIATAFEEGEVAVHIEERFLLAYIFCFFFSVLFYYQWASWHGSTKSCIFVGPTKYNFELTSPSTLSNSSCKDRRRVANKKACGDYASWMHFVHGNLTKLDQTCSLMIPPSVPLLLHPWLLRVARSPSLSMSSRHHFLLAQFASRSRKRSRKKRWKWRWRSRASLRWRSRWRSRPRRKRSHLHLHLRHQCLGRATEQIGNLHKQFDP